MSLTAQERTSIIKLVVVMFNAAPGATYLAELADVYEANGRSLSNLAKDLANTGAYKALNPSFQTASEFASAFLTPLGLQGNSEAVDFVIAKFNAGVSKGQIAYDASVAISKYTGGDAQILAAQAIQNNKTEVAEYFSVTKGIADTNLGHLQALLVGVNADHASVVAATAAAADATFTLTTDSETILGTPGNNLITGTEKTLAFDEIDGGAGVDKLRLVIGTDGLNGSLGETVKNVEEVVIQTLGNVTTDISGYTGVQNINVTAVNGKSVDLTSAAAESVTIKASQGSVYLTDETAKVIDVATGGYASVTAGDATSITVNAGSSDNEGYGAYVSAGDVGTIAVNALSSNAGVYAGNATSISVDAGYNAYVNAGDVGSIDVNAGANADVKTGSSLAIDVAAVGNADVAALDSAAIKVAAGGYATVVVGQADDFSQDNNGFDISLNVPTIVSNVDSVNVTSGYNAGVLVSGNAGSIMIDSGSYANVQVGVYGQESSSSVYEGEGSSSFAGVAAVASTVGTVEVNAVDDAQIYVVGNAGTINVVAGDYAEVQVGAWGEQAYSYVNGGDTNVQSGLATIASTVDAINVTTTTGDADVYVLGDAGAITVKAGGDVDVEVGDYGDNSYSYSNADGTNTQENLALAAAASSVDSVNVTSGDHVDVDVVGNANTITVHAVNGMHIDIGDMGYGAETYMYDSEETYQYGASATIASTVGTINAISTGENESVYVDVVGNAGAITIASAGYASVEVGSQGDEAYKYDNGSYTYEYAGVATVASSADAIDVTSADDTNITVIGSVGTVKVAAGQSVYIDVGYEGYKGNFNEETGLGSKDLAAVISNVDSIDVTAGNDVSIGITGDAGQITLAVGADPEHNSQVQVNVGGTIDALSITGAEGQRWHSQAVDVVAGAITAMSLTDVSRAVVIDEGTSVADAALVRNAPENVSIELTSVDATSLDLTVAGVIANLEVSNSASVPAQISRGADTEIDLATLNLTVNEYALAYTETVVTVVDEVETSTEVEHSFIVDSEINLVSEEVKTLNVAGAGNLLLDVAAANALNLIDAHTATGNITVALDGNDAVSYLGGAGVDTVTLTGTLPAWIDVQLTPFLVETKPSFNLDGGAGGVDVLKMDAALAATAIASSGNTGFVEGSITNFNILNLSNVADGVAAAASDLVVDATLFGTDHVVLDAGGAYSSGGYALDLTIADAGTVEIAGNGLLNVNVDTAEDDSNSLTLVLNGGDKSLLGNNGISITGIDVQAEAKAVESIALVSNGHAFDIDMDAQSVVGTINALGLKAADATTITITGDAFLDLTDDAIDLVGRVLSGDQNYESETVLTSVKTIDASAFDAGLILDLSLNTTGATITVGNGLNFILASQGNDTITVGDGSNSPLSQIPLLPNGLNVGNVIWGGLGKDTINLAVGTASDILVYDTALDSSGINMDVVTGFQANFVIAQDLDGNDIFGHDIIVLAGLLTSATYTGGVTYLGEVNGYAAANTALSENQSNSLEVVLDTTNNQLYADVTNDGVIGAGDLVIKLAGVADLSQANFDLFSSPV